jgi:peptidoglycan/LPS O-acetylase OafA/YrhL
MVLLFHFLDYSPVHIGAFKYGWLGVDLFFLLSGYLITNILLAAKDSPDYFRNFYKRRVFRIFPLYYCTVAVFFLFELPLWHRAGTMLYLPSSEQVWYWSYLANFRIAAGHVYGPVSHFWSLALEEQFYFIWPAVVYLVSRKNLRWVIAAVFVASCAMHQEYFRLYGLCIGAWCAVAGYRMPSVRFLRFPLFTDLGKYSYGLYVLHPVVMRFLFPLTEATLYSLLFFPLSYLIARFSWEFIEAPCLRLRDRPTKNAVKSPAIPRRELVIDLRDGERTR